MSDAVNSAALSEPDLVEVIAVGDCSIAANTDNAARGTDFVAAFDDVRHISELPEDDSGTELSDDGGLDCYVAELQALQDALGNSTWLGGSTARVQSGGSFGVDRNGPEVSRLSPDEEVVLSVNEVTFEAEDPELETGEDGSGLTRVVGQRFRSGRYRSEVIRASEDDGDVTANVSGLDDGAQSVRVLVGDAALPTNWGFAIFDFTRDTKAPTFTVGSGPGAVSAGSSDRVTVTVSGSVRDANVIDKAELSVWSNGGSPAICGPDDDGDSELPRSRVRPKDVENDTKRIDFEESFTIRKASGGSEMLCFRLDVSDVAVDASGDDEGANTAGYTAGFFTINWGLGMTFSGTDLVDGALEMDEGASVSYEIELDAQPSADVTVTIGGMTNSNVTVDVPDNELTFTAGNWDTPQIVTVTGAEDARDDDDPEDAANDMVTLTHTASGGGYDGITGSPVPVTVLDNDVLLTVASHDISVGDAATTVTLTATLANAIPATGSARTVSVAFTDGEGAATTGIDVTEVAVTIEAGESSGTADVQVDASGTGVSSGTIMVGGGDAAPDQVPATITIKAASS